MSHWNWKRQVRQRLAVTTALLAALSLGLLLSGGAVEAGSWGLSFQEEGQAPVGDRRQRRAAPV